MCSSRSQRADFEFGNRPSPSAPGRILTRRRCDRTGRGARESGDAVAAEWREGEGPGCGQRPTANTVPESALRSGAGPCFSVAGFVLLSLLCIAGLGGVAAWARAVGARTLRHARGKGTFIEGEEEGPDSLPLSPGRGRSNGRRIASGLDDGGGGSGAERTSPGARPASMTSVEPREPPSRWVRRPTFARAEGSRGRAPASGARRSQSEPTLRSRSRLFPVSPSMRLRRRLRRREALVSRPHFIAPKQGHLRTFPVLGMPPCRASSRPDWRAGLLKSKQTPPKANDLPATMKRHDPPTQPRADARDHSTTTARQPAPSRMDMTHAWIVDFMASFCVLPTTKAFVPGGADRGIVRARLGAAGASDLRWARVRRDRSGHRDVERRSPESLRVCGLASWVKRRWSASTSWGTRER